MANMLYYQLNSGMLPNVKFVDKVTVEPPHVHIRRKTEEFILYYVISGEMHINENNCRYILRQDDVLILDPNYEHYGVKPTNCTYFYVHFYHHQMIESADSYEKIKDTLVDLRISSLQSHECDFGWNNGNTISLPKYFHVNHATVSSNLMESLYRLRESHHNQLEHFKYKTNCVFLEFLISLSRELTSSFLNHNESISASRSTQMVHDLLAFFQNNYALSISSKSIEQEFDCSFDYMNRLFKKATGITIFVYLNNLRIAKAKQLLAEGNFKMLEVAEKSGFKDVYYFSKVFKKYTGSSPGSFSRAMF